MTGCIERECAGNMLVVRRPHDTARVDEIVARLRRISNPVAGFNNLGLKEHGLSALLTVSVEHVEITRIFVDPRHRGRGMFMSFVERMLEVCHTMRRGLTIGCVEGQRLEHMLSSHPQMWQRMASDPTSFERV